MNHNVSEHKHTYMRYGGGSERRYTDCIHYLGYTKAT